MTTEKALEITLYLLYSIKKQESQVIIYKIISNTQLNNNKSNILLMFYSYTILILSDKLIMERMISYE